MNKSVENPVTSFVWIRDLYSIELQKKQDMRMLQTFTKYLLKILLGSENLHPLESQPFNEKLIKVTK